MNKNVILAITPGKRRLGIAVFSEFDLRYTAVKTIKYRPPQKNLFEEITLILKKLFQEFSISAVVIKAINQYQKLSSALDEIVEHIKFECRRKDLRVVAVTIDQVKSGLCTTGKLTQKKAFEALLIFYPELEQYWNRPNKWQNDYYAFLFSAVAVGTVYFC